MRLRAATLPLLVFASAAWGQSGAPSPEVRQIAGIMGITSRLEEFAAIKDQPASTEQTIRKLVLRQRITEAVIETSLDVEAVVASIQREQAQIQDAIGRVTAQRDRIANLTTIAATVTGSGIGVIGSAMQFSDKSQYAGDGISIGSGVASTILSLLGMRIQAGGQARVGTAPNMLARPLGSASNAISFWPDDVWTYLSSAPASGSGQASRLELLKQEWIRQGRTGIDGSPAATRKIAFLTGSFANAKRSRVSDLEDRSAMLADLRGQVAVMNRELAQLLHQLRDEGW